VEHDITMETTTEEHDITTTPSAAGEVSSVLPQSPTLWTDDAYREIMASL